MGGCNNNPTTTHFEPALRKLLCKQSIQLSKAANTLDCESSSGVFRLTWSKRRSPLPEVDVLPVDESVLSYIPCNMNTNTVEDNVLYYICGYIVRTLRGTITCDICSEALVENEPPTTADHNYITKRASDYCQLTSIKNRGHLIYSSNAVFKTVCRCEAIFRTTVVAGPKKILGHQRLKEVLSALFNRSIHEEQPMVTFTHTCATEMGLLPHTQQLTNTIVDKYFSIRLKHYGRTYNRLTIAKGAGSDRSRLSRLVIFKHQ
jgi:hypothetical protein